MYWDRLTSPQLEQLDKNLPVVLPIAATEQHGPHLPLATDRMIGEHFCEQLETQIPNHFLILPTISIGCSEHHMDFAGSLSVQHQTFLNQLLDIAGCIVKHGFKNLLVLNSHGGNMAIGGTFLEIFGYRHPQCQVLLATWWRLALEELQPLNGSGPGSAGHAGEFETSLMLLIAPELVQVDQISSQVNVPTFDWAESDMLAAGRVQLYRTMKAKTPNGVYGYAGRASKEMGMAISRIVVDQLKKILLDLRHAN